jgi:hypothetical protein
MKHLTKFPGRPFLIFLILLVLSGCSIYRPLILTKPQEDISKTAIITGACSGSIHRIYDKDMEMLLEYPWRFLVNYYFFFQGCKDMILYPGVYNFEVNPPHPDYPLTAVKGQRKFIACNLQPGHKYVVTGIVDEIIKRDTTHWPRIIITYTWDPKCLE